MLRDAVQFLLDMVVNSFAAVLILRFHLQWLRAPLFNPIGQFVMAITDFVVLPARRHVRPFRGLDSATLLLALAVETLYLLATVWVQGFPIEGFAQLGVVFWAMVGLLKLSIYLLMGAVIMEALLSWINPHSALAPLLAAINRPFITPLRKRIQPLNGIDFTPFVLLILCQLTLILPVGFLESTVRLLLWHERVV
ncbi:MAG TPA: YggT family protein [Gallionellaceae bacterium]